MIPTFKNGDVLNVLTFSGKEYVGFAYSPEGLFKFIFEHQMILKSGIYLFPISLSTLSISLETLPNNILIPYSSIFKYKIL